MKKLFAILLCIGMVAGIAVGGFMMVRSLANEPSSQTETQEETVQYTTREKAYAQLHSDLEPDEVKKRVRLGLDQEPISSAQELKDPGSLTALVNAYHTLPASYVPEDLVAIASPDPATPNGLRKEAADSFQALVDAAKEHGFDLSAAAAFISYENLQTLHQQLVDEYGETSADQNILMNPGFSEYQTGLALDLDLNGKTFEDVKSDPNYSWLIEQLPQYGFIVRYPEGKEEITLLDAQPWHIRYVGKDAAQTIVNKDLSLEEYSLQ